MDWCHNRLFRISLLLAAVLVAMAGILPYFISLDLLRNALAERIASDTRRKLDIQGDTRLVLLPRPALLLGKASLSEPDSTAIFAQAERTRIALSIWPLISRAELHVRELDLEKPQLKVLRREDGSLNFEDLLVHDDADRQLHFGLEEMHFNEAELRFSDEFLGNSLVLSKLDMHLSNLADPRNGLLQAQGGVILGKDRTDWRGQLTAHAAMRYNAEEKRLLVADLNIDLQQQGESSPEWRVAQGKLQVSGNLVYGWQPLRLTGGELKLTGETKRVEQHWKLDLDLPEIALHENRLALNKLKLSAAMTSPYGSFDTRMEVPSFAGAPHALLRADAAKIEMKVISPEQSLALVFSSPLELRQGAQFALPAYRLTGSYGNRSLPRGAIPFDLQGEGTLDPRQEWVTLNSHGKLDGSPIKAGFRLNDFVTPRYQFDLDLARLDLTPYLPAVAANAKTIDQDQPYDLWWLQRLEAEGNVRIGELIMQKMHIHQLNMKMKAAKRKLVLDPLSAMIYEGQLTGRAEVDADRKAPLFRLQQRLLNMNINTLLADVLSTSRFEGRGSFDLDISAVGSKVSDLRHTAGGNVRMQLSKGAIRGIDVEAVLRAASRQMKLISGKAPPQPANLDARTSFSELRASLVLKHGVASNNDLLVSAGVLKLQGGGELNLGEGTLDYTLNASANPKVRELADLTGLTLPIQIVGPLANPEYKVDYSSLKTQLLAKKASPASKPAAIKKRPPAPTNKR